MISVANTNTSWYLIIMFYYMKYQLSICCQVLIERGIYSIELLLVLWSWIFCWQLFKIRSHQRILKLFVTIYWKWMVLAAIYSWECLIRYTVQYGWGKSNMHGIWLVSFFCNTPLFPLGQPLVSRTLHIPWNRCEGRFNKKINYIFWNIWFPYRIYKNVLKRSKHAQS